MLYLSLFFAYKENFIISKVTNNTSDVVCVKANTDGVITMYASTPLEYKYTTTNSLIKRRFNIYYIV